MAHYLVAARPRQALLGELAARLGEGAFTHLEPFGPTLSVSLERARRQPDGMAIWEEEDYCHPPLAEERAAVLDQYFDGLSVERVTQGSGWERIAELPLLFPELAERGMHSSS